jgi:hypothetical protein
MASFIFGEIGTRKSTTMGRKRINHEATQARFPAGTLKRIDVALEERESRGAFIRLAVERELERRGDKPKKPKKAHRAAV